jgi:hypothetical protein
MTQTTTFKYKKLVRSFALFLKGMGFDLRKLYALRRFPKFKKDYKDFKKLGGTITHHHMILTDFTDQAGKAKGHYFHQDLLVSSYIYQKKPVRHVDIGSRIDGFVAHVAAFRRIEVFDVRDLQFTGHRNIVFKKADMMGDLESQHGLTDSLSCLHTIEHFGLGRYGDPVDPQGYLKGFNNMLKMLKPSGNLYISFPIGVKNEVHFNAHRVFHPTDILGWALPHYSLQLERFDFVDDEGKLHKNIDLKNEKIDVNFGCGIYTFRKLH